jgi:hypothetical protein
MEGGLRLDAGREPLERIRGRTGAELAKLPGHLLGLGQADPPYRVEISATLTQRQAEVIARIAAKRG